MSQTYVTRLGGWPTSSSDPSKVWVQDALSDRYIEIDRHGAVHQVVESLTGWKLVAEVEQSFVIQFEGRSPSIWRPGDDLPHRLIPEEDPVFISTVEHGIVLVSRTGVRFCDARGAIYRAVDISLPSWRLARCAVSPDDRYVVIDEREPFGTSHPARIVCCDMNESRVRAIEELSSNGFVFEIVFSFDSERAFLGYPMVDRIVELSLSDLRPTDLPLNERPLPMPLIDIAPHPGHTVAPAPPR